MPRKNEATIQRLHINTFLFGFVLSRLQLYIKVHLTRHVFQITWCEVQMTPAQQKKRRHMVYFSCPVLSTTCSPLHPCHFPASFPSPASPFPFLSLPPLIPSCHFLSTFACSLSCACKPWWCLQKAKHHATAAAPAASTSSQASSLTQLQHTHSNAAASERDPDEVSSKGPHHRPAVPSSGALQALQHAGSTAMTEQDGMTVHSGQPMQVWTLHTVCCLSFCLPLCLHHVLLSLCMCLHLNAQRMPMCLGGCMRTHCALCMCQGVHMSAGSGLLTMSKVKCAFHVHTVHVEVCFDRS